MRDQRNVTDAYKIELIEKRVKHDSTASTVTAWQARSDLEVRGNDYPSEISNRSLLYVASRAYGVVRG